jgi:hypothetical protein
MRRIITICALVVVTGCAQGNRQQIQGEMVDIKQQGAAVTADCRTEMDNDRALDPIRNKVELIKGVEDGPAPFSILSNTSYPSATERQAVAEWGRIRDDCMRRAMAIPYVPPSANAIQTNYLQQIRQINLQAIEQVGSLIVALSQGKMTYGEFAQKRTDITNSALDTLHQFQQASLEADAQRQQQAEALAQQRLQNSLAAWNIYMQSVEARQPVLTTTNCLAMGNALNCTAISQ